MANYNERNNEAAVEITDRQRGYEETTRSLNSKMEKEMATISNRHYGEPGKIVEEHRNTVPFVVLREHNELRANGTERIQPPEYSVGARQAIDDFSEREGRKISQSRERLQERDRGMEMSL